MIHFKKLLQSPVYVVATFVFIFLLAGIAFYLWNSPKKFSQQPQKLTSEILREKLRKAFIKNQRQRDPAAKINVQALRQSVQKLFPGSPQKAADLIKPKLLNNKGVFSSPEFMNHLNFLYKLEKNRPPDLEEELYNYVENFLKGSIVEVRSGRLYLGGDHLETIIILFTRFLVKRKGLVNHVNYIYRMIFEDYLKYLEPLENITESIAGSFKKVFDDGKTIINIPDPGFKELLDRKIIINILDPGFKELLDRKIMIERIILKLFPEEINQADLGAIFYLFPYTHVQAMRGTIRETMEKAKDRIFRSFSGRKFVYRAWENIAAIDEIVVNLFSSKYFGLREKEDIEFFLQNSSDRASIYLWRNLKDRRHIGQYPGVAGYIEEQFGERLRELYFEVSKDSNNFEDFITQPFVRKLFEVAEESENMSRAVYKMLKQIPGFE